MASKMAGGMKNVKLDLTVGQVWQDTYLHLHNICIWNITGSDYHEY
jgi:hypothetical protein